jgi:phage replication O-like protein O
MVVLEARMSIESPQLEDGFTPIANAIMDALARTRFSGYERSVLDFLFRKTYGWSKKSDLISLGQFVDATKIAKPHIVHTIKRLVDRNIIHKTVAKTGNDTLMQYEFNKHWGEWTSLPKMVTPKLALPEMAIDPLPKMAPTISISTTTSKRLKKSTLGEGIQFDYEKGDWNGIDEKHRNIWHLAYPPVNLEYELLNMAMYLIDNPKKKYTNYGAFIRNWLSRSLGRKPVKRDMSVIGKANIEEWSEAPIPEMSAIGKANVEGWDV